jgi:chromate transporter
VEPFLYGIKPAVIAVILGAMWKLGRTAVKDWRFAVLGLGWPAAVLGPGRDPGRCSSAGCSACSGSARVATTAGRRARYVPILFLRPSAAVGAAGSAGAAAAGLAASGAGVAGAVATVR